MVRVTWNRTASPGPSFTGVTSLSLPLAPFLWIPLALTLWACGNTEADPQEGAREESPATPSCGTLVVNPASAPPFEWVQVQGLPKGFGPGVAEVTAPGQTTMLIAPVIPGEGGSAAVRVPLHPSFTTEGGEVEIRLVSDIHTCEPALLSIEPLAPSPGAMGEVAEALRTALDQLGVDMGADRLSEEMLTSGDPVPLLAVGALWSLPELEVLERLMEADAVRAESPDDAALLDAVAGHLDLADRMRAFGGFIAASRELTGELSIDVPRPLAESRARAGNGLSGESRADVGAPRLASPARLLSSFIGSLRPPAPPRQEEEASTQETSANGMLQCGADQQNLFDIAEPEKLDNLMRVQDYAQRFLAGAQDEEGGSAAGTVFGDIGTVAALLEMAGKQGEAIATVWEAFSTVVLNSAEAFEGLLPGELELAVVATPEEFPEDSEETGRWTAAATATSDGMKLTDQVLEKVMEKALDKGLGDASLGQPLKRQAGAAIPDEVLDETSGRAAVFWNRVGDRAAGEIDAQARGAASDAMKSFLDAIGAEEGPDGFDIPGGCWSLGDMSASDDGSPEGIGTPALVVGELSGDAVRFIQDGSQAPREYEPVQAGTSRLEVRTAEGYAKNVPGMPFDAVSYAFGGEQSLATTEITVLPIEVELTPSIARVSEPGQEVQFVATVHNANDPGVEWRSDVGVFENRASYPEGVHEATLSAPWADASMYPMEVEVESTADTGPREGRDPPRLATARIYLNPPTLDVSPAVACLRPGEERQFSARLEGAPESGVQWEVRDRSDGGNGSVDDHGSFVARTAGTVRVYATLRRESDIQGYAEVEIGPCDTRWSANIGGGPASGAYMGSDGYVNIASRSGQEGDRQIVEGQVMSIGLKTRPGDNRVPLPGSCPFILLEPIEDGVLPSAASFMAIGSVTFADCEGEFGNLMDGTGYELGNGNEGPPAPGPILVSFDDVTDDRITGTFTGRFYQARHQSENNFIEYERQFTVSGSFSLVIQDWP